MLDLPWEFRDFAVGLDFRGELLKGAPNSPRTQREALLHLVFPDTFEAIVSVDHKANIAKTFANLAPDPEEDIDRRLAQIRPAIEAEYGYGGISFYRPELRVHWDDNYTPDLCGTGDPDLDPPVATGDPWSPLTPRSWPRNCFGRAPGCRYPPRGTVH